MSARWHLVGVDTGEDEAITLDTVPIRGAVVYRVGAEEVAPGTAVYYVTDGDVRVPAQSERHAWRLAEAMTLVELAEFGSHGWLHASRAFVIALTRWLNAADLRTRLL